MTIAMQEQTIALDIAAGESTGINEHLTDLVIGSPNDSPLNRGLSAVVRNRVLIALAQPAGLAHLMYDPETDSIENVREALKAAGQWLIRVAEEAQ